MTLDQVRTLMHAQPFQPFDIRMADGRSFAIDHPDYLAVPAEGRMIVAYNRAGRVCEFVDLLLVTSLDVGRSGGDAS